ncbi:Mor transcription activator family protein [Nitrosovibrio sp. Nv4]|uniref:Mor transcription activator family protein n=1 Tax=Nitrosovibrio sp. Nv4 TaxID=1945880 RepID=UPI000BDA45E1|nr:Mor transcription activator family protein [Nitrosovibrio sp. Nv4]SOD42310.1 Mor transcription activator family protein [Nitrosovibrio sp. Nv4]
MVELDESLLPGILRDIARLIGLPGTLQLVKHYGGVRLYVPKRFDPDHVLVKVIGPVAVIILIKHFGGEAHFDIPRALAAANAVRNAAIRAEYAELSQRRLAQKYNLTERQVRNILAGDEPDEMQEKLF